MEGFYTYMKKVFKLTISQDKSSGMHYVEPFWKQILRENKLDYYNKYSINSVEQMSILSLEKDKLNAKNNKINFVADWICNIIKNDVDPTMTAEENELMKNLVEYMKLNSEQKESEQDELTKIENNPGEVKMPVGISFAKK